MQQLVSAEKTSQHIREIAAEIVRDYPSSPLFIALLRGAAPFASQLMFAITSINPDYHPELDYMVVSTYGDGRIARMPQIITDVSPSTQIAGRDVIILDDVLDKGITAQFVINELTNRQPRSIALAVLVDKQTEREEPVTARYAAFELPDVWLTGMGMDDSHVGPEANRWNNAIYEVN